MIIELEMSLRRLYLVSNNDDENDDNDAAGGDDDYVTRGGCPYCPQVGV